MKLSDFKTALQSVKTVRFLTPDGGEVPSHFHITEAGLTTKHFIDCGGTVRKESVVSMQLWTADDYDHSLTPGKLLGILNKADALFENRDLDLEIEYQGDTIGRYGVELDNGLFRLVSKQTDCLAKESCGISSDDRPSAQSHTRGLQPANACAPGSGCC